jgi:hypothetical protein
MIIETQVGENIYIPEDILCRIGSMLGAKSAIAFSGVCRSTRRLKISTFEFAKSIVDSKMPKFVEKFNPQSIHVEQLAVMQDLPIPECVTADTVMFRDCFWEPNPDVERVIAGAKSVVVHPNWNIGVFPNIKTVWSQATLKSVYRSFPNTDVVTICDRVVTAEEILQFGGSVLHLTKCTLPGGFVFNGKTLMITSTRNSGAVSEIRFTRSDSTLVYVMDRYKHFRDQHLLWVHGAIDQLIVGGETVGNKYCLSVTAEGARVLAARSVVIECPSDYRFIIGCYDQQDDTTGPVSPVEFREYEKPESELARFCAATRNVGRLPISDFLKSE